MAVLPGLLKRFTSTAKKTDVKQPEHRSGSIWQDTGEVDYLENTLNLTYAANARVVTLEKLSADSLANVVEALDRLPPDSPFARLVTVTLRYSYPAGQFQQRIYRARKNGY